MLILTTAFEWFVVRRTVEKLCFQVRDSKLLHQALRGTLLAADFVRRRIHTPQGKQAQCQ